MRFWVVVAMLLVADTVWCRNVQMSLDVANRVHLLHRLIASGQQGEFIRLLPQLRDYVNSQDDEGHTPLHWMVYADDIDGAEHLLLHDGDPNLSDNYGRTAVHEAARVGSNDMLNLMLDNGGDPKVRDQRHNWDAVFWAAFSGKKESLQTLMQHVDTHGQKANNMGIYGAVLQQDDPTKMGSVDKDKMAKVKLLLEAGIVPDIGVAMMLVVPQEMTALAKLFNAYAGKVKFNTKHVNAMDTSGQVTLLMKAMMAGSVTAAEFLLDQGANVNTVNVNGQNALASRYDRPEHLEIAKLYLEHGIDVHNSEGAVAFYSALIHDDVELAELLLEQATAEEGRKTVPDGWYVFDSPTLGVSPAIQLAQSQNMRNLLLDYDLAQPTKLAAVVRKLQLTDAEGQDGQQLSRRSNANVPDFLIDFNALAAAGKFKPVIGREQEIQQVITTLARKEKNNPLLVGEAGVGKTAVVEGLAQRIVAGDVPEAMRNKTVYALDMGMLLTYGGGFRGALEDTITGTLLPFLEENDGNAILFIDEVHQLISSRMAAGMADQLKPALARGDLHCIGATTHDEYQQHIMKDSALERRFLPVTVKEPSIEDTVAIVAGLKGVYEEHHGIKIDDSGVEGVVKLANQYVTNRYNPDKAIDLLDMAAAKVALQASDNSVVQFKHVAAVVAEMTGVPVARMLISEQEIAQKLLPFLQENIFGQDRVLQEVANGIVPSLVGFGNRDRPVSMLLLGPTGVGKTETAKLLAELLFGSKDNLININLSEYKQQHEFSSLTGAPAGYIGYEESGVLTEAVRRKPFSVVLFDEIGEAHPDFAGILLKIIDEGELADKKGRTINFRNTIIIITSNTKAGRAHIGFGESAKSRHAVAASEVDIKAKLRGRLGAILTYDSLGPEVVGKLIDKQLERFNALLAQKNISVSLTDTLRKHLHEKGYNPELGARPLQTAFIELIDNPMAMEIAAGKLEEGQHYRLGFRNGKITIKAKVAGLSVDEHPVESLESQP